MKKKNKIFSLLLIVAVLVLGIGYALSTDPLNISGTATAQQSATSFNVKFTGAQAGTPITDTESKTVASSTANVVSDKLAEMTVTLTNVGNEQKVTFTVQNDSQTGVKATIPKNGVKIYKTGTQEEYSSEFFTVETNINEDIVLASKDSTTFTVTVKLQKAVVSETAHQETFTIVLDGITAGQE